MQVAAVIFDMDGLMIDTEGPVQACCQRAAADMGFDLDDEFYVSELVGRGWTDCDAALMSRFGWQFSCAEFRTRFERLWEIRLGSHGINVKPGFRELFVFLRSTPTLVAVATSTHGAEAAISLRAAGIDERFDAFVTGDEVTTGKPAPEIYLTAAARLGVDPRQCVALEDSSAGVLAASRAGMTTFLVPDNGRKPTREAETVAFQVLPSLHAVRTVLSDWLRKRP